MGRMCRLGLQARNALHCHGDDDRQCPRIGGAIEMVRGCPPMGPVVRRGSTEWTPLQGFDQEKGRLGVARPDEALMFRERHPRTEGLEGKGMGNEWIASESRMDEWTEREGRVILQVVTAGKEWGIRGAVRWTVFCGVV